jgi:NCS1 family nucleobase:cation symporter-1
VLIWYVILPQCLFGNQLILWLSTSISLPTRVPPFGFYFARFAVVVRMITALFWHGTPSCILLLVKTSLIIIGTAIQTYTGSTALTQMIRAIWPSYLNIPNHLPLSAGVTSQQLLSHFLFWSIQFPFLLIQPHKLQWFFVFKSVLVTSVSLATVIAVCVKAGGAGDIWDQQPTVSGSTRSWLILSSMSSITGGWWVN